MCHAARHRRESLGERVDYANALWQDGATLDELREAVETLADAERIAQRVFGGAHPLTKDIETNLQVARATLRARAVGRSVVFTTT